MDLAADGVADLVGRDDRALAFVHRPPARRPNGDLQPARMQVFGRDRLACPPRSEDRGLVEQVGQLGAREAVRLTGQARQVGLGRERLVARVNFEDLAAPDDVWQADVDLAVEAARPKHGGVEGVDPVCRRDHDDVVGRREAVQLHEQLVERLLPLLVAVDATPRLAERVELVEEDHATAELPRVGEQLADPPCADADVLLHELGARRVVERHAGLAGHGTREHRLAGAGRAPEHDAARDAGAQAMEALGRLQELDRLGQLELGFVAAGDVGQQHGGHRPRRGDGCARRIGCRCGFLRGWHDRPELGGGVTSGRADPADHAHQEDHQERYEQDRHQEGQKGSEPVCRTAG